MGSKMWEIRESYGDRMGRRSGVPQRYEDDELQEAYECGWEEHAEMTEGRMGERYGRREYPEAEHIGYRRMRDSRGRYM